MIKVDISGMADGEYEFDFLKPIATLECAFDEFFGDVKVALLVVKLGTRYTLKAKSECYAKMLCDRSLKEFEENIFSEFQLAYRADTKLFLESNGQRELNNEIIIREDFKYIDITSEVLEHLALELPMKRIAPEFRDKEITEIFPELDKDRIVGENSVDDRWTKLKDFKIN